MTATATTISIQYTRLGVRSFMATPQLGTTGFVCHASSIDDPMETVNAAEKETPCLASDGFRISCQAQGT
jgi:hypothetical protein